MPASVVPEQEHRPEMGLLMAVCSVGQVGKRALPALVERKRRIVDIVDHDSDPDGFSFPQFSGEKIVCGEKDPVTVSVLRAGEGAGNFRGDGVVLRRVDAESELLVRRAGAPDDRGGAGGVRVDRVVVIVVVISADFALLLQERGYVADATNITQQELDNIIELDVSRDGDTGNDIIRTLKGVEFCTNLQFLDCSNQKLEDLDLSSNLKLVRLDCSDCFIQTIKLDKCVELAYLDCAGNNISELNVSGNPDLDTLMCGESLLQELSLQNNAKLRYLDCNRNPLKQLDISNNRELSYLDCELCVLEHLSVDNELNPQLIWVSCSYNKIQSIDLSKASALKVLECNGCNLENIDLSGCSSLTGINCINNRIESLDISKAPLLERISCGGNLLKTINLKDNKHLKVFHSYKNPFVNLDIDGLAELEALTCQSSNIENVTVSSCPSLININFSYNEKLQSFCIIDSPAIEIIKINNNAELEILDLGGLPNLTELDCAESNLKALNLENCPNIKTLWCYSTSLTSLDISKCTALEYLNCLYNPGNGEHFPVYAWFDSYSIPADLIIVANDNYYYNNVQYEDLAEYYSWGYGDDVITLDFRKE